MNSSTPTLHLTYPPAIEQALGEIESLLRGDYPLRPRTLALLLLQGDPEIWDEVQTQESSQTLSALRTIVERLQAQSDAPLAWQIDHHRQQWSQQVTQQVMHTLAPARPQTLAQWVGWLCMNPWTGFPILALVLYFGLYQFVGVFGAGTVVDLIEETLFGEYINPAVESFVRQIIPWAPLQELLVGEYGVWTLGVTYAVALILPIVTFFFLVFALLEDTGYLPRLALLIDRVFKAMGLNGRAVIPIVLGFGCDTMATVVTRVLETRRERIITTFLLALTIPCSAQLGVVLALLSAYPLGLALWAGILVLVFLVAGWLSAQVLPGTPMPFYMEIPPMRLPSLSNVLLKTLARLQWYFMEVFPLFIVASVLIWLGQLTGVFEAVLRAMTPLSRLLDLPESANVAILFGFFRRDYGAAGLYDLVQKGLIAGNQVLVVAVVLTLFVPCVAQLLITLKERGWKAGVAMFLIAFTTALAVGATLAWTLRTLGVSIG